VRLPGLKGAERQGKRHEGDGSRDPEHRSPAIGYDGEDDIRGMRRNKGEIVQRISVLSITLGVGRTPAIQLRAAFWKARGSASCCCT
jgi:hypothetical protein